jgi:D-serine deaminase-like pyridoxal phosphate-dependent protein
MSDYPLIPNLTLDEYRIDDADLANVMTPALLIYPKIVTANIRATLKQTGDDPNRWRPHVKTAKSKLVLRQYLDHGVTQFKCATTLELLKLSEVGAPDVLLAYSVMGANARRTAEIAAKYPNTRISATIEHPAQVEQWSETKVALYIDLNAGMNRSGLDQFRVDDIVQLAKHIIAAGIAFAGLHYYDGHMSNYPMPERTLAAHKNFDHLMKVVALLEANGITVPEVITSGTPGYPCALSYTPFKNASFTHRVSPGTVVFSDIMCCSNSPKNLPLEFGYRPAALVLANVLGQPAPQRINVNAGSKAVSADAGVPTCQVVGHADWEPTRPSEEHMPVQLPPNAPMPAIGESVYLVPLHVCTTVNNFDQALIVENGKIIGVEDISARGRERPI